ncbi:MAG: fused MFS/spermidine synthase, partial [Fibrobacter sp.]|nr:fused MFS/spermidine synthase [Fibrobacter sp.]
MYLSLYYLLFFFSGIAGLVYESIWSHYLKLFLGHAAYSQTLVLVIYMGGMALGAWAGGLLIKKVKNLLLYYAGIEIILGIAALFFHDLFQVYLSFSYDTVIPSIDNPLIILCYKWVSSSILILPQSILLGATFPCMAAGFIRNFPGSDGYKIAFLYFTNTIGAALGVLLSGFFLVDRVGLRGTVITGGLIDIFVGVTIAGLHYSTKKTNELPLHKPLVQQKNSIQGKEYYRSLLFVSAVTAVASFMYEIGWIRMLSLVLGSSTHSFELMLSAFILGMALGSFFIRKQIDRLVDIPVALVIAQVVMGSCALLTIFTYGHMFNLMKFIINALSKNDQGYLLFNVFSHAICLLIMLPSTVCAGMVLPLIIHLFYKNNLGEETIGKVYAVNTLGAIAGVIVAVWVLMPVFGLKLLIITGGSIDIALGLFILFKFKKSGTAKLKKYLPALSAVAVSFTLVFGKFDPVLVCSGVFRNGTIYKNKKMLYCKDGKTASVSLFRSRGNLVLTTNGKPDASVNVRGGLSGDEYTMALVAVLPLAVIKESVSAAVIGMGSGMTAHYMLYDSTLKSLDVIEIEPAIVEAAKLIGDKVSNTFTDKRCHIYIDDAKTFFSAHNRKYDVIVSEPSNPWVSGVSGLFSEEFFAQMKKHLNKNGVLIQWFHKYESDVSILVSIFKSLQQHFPHYCMYMAGTDLITIATCDTSADLSLKRDLFNITPLAWNLRQMKFSSIEDLTIMQFASEKLFNPLFNVYDFPPNSDYYPFVDLNAVKYRFTDENIRVIDTLRKYIIPVRKILEKDTILKNYQVREELPDLNNFSDFNRAKTIYSHLLMISSDSLGSMQPADLSNEVITIDYVSKNPRNVSFDQLFNTLGGLLENTIPYLSASEMRTLYQIVEKKISSLELTDDDRIWLKYIKALCNYNMVDLQETVRYLLPLETDIEANYLNQF